MLLEVYDKDTLNRVDIIRTYTFVQYTDYFNDVGTFTVKVPIKEKSLPHLLVAGNYILFEQLGDKMVMGVIKYFHKEGVETPTVEVKGYMLSHLLTYRCFRTTFRRSGRVFDIQREFVTKQFINPDDLRRQVDVFMLSFDYDDNTAQIDYCQTGTNAVDAIRDMNEPYRYGFALVPAIAKYNPQTGKEQNIANIVFKQYVPVDHRVGNTQGNDPVVFDTELSNVEDLMFELDSTKAKTVAYVAGEDSGENRKVIETGDTEATGLNRNELYVDARDLQKQESDEFEFSTPKMIGDGSRQTVWNSASVESLQGVQINSFQISGTFSVYNPTQDDTAITLYVRPYLGNVPYTEVTLAEFLNVETDSTVGIDFDVTVNASDENLDYFDSFVIFCLSTNGFEYRVGGEMRVDSIPKQDYATTDEEYESMLVERGNEKLDENRVQYGFEATAFTNTNNAFRYGEEYKNGDYVTVIDRNLGMSVGVQITGVMKSLTETGEILDLIFGNQIL